MNREVVVNKLQSIFRDIFDAPDLVIFDSMTADDIDNWDSLNHINVLVAIQQEFKIKITLDELQRLNSVGTIINLLCSHIKI